MGMKQTEIGEIPEDWDLVKLGEIGENFIGLTYSPSDVNTYGTLVLRSSNIQNGQLAFKDNVYVKMDLPSRVITKKNDILICVRNGSRQLIGKCTLINEKAEGSAFGAFMTVYRTDYYNFILHQFNSEIIQKQIRVMMGATINQITNKDLKNFIVPLPRKIKEQDEISKVLTDTDNLIQATEQLINKKQLIKTATMQNLLTGKIRLAEFDTKQTKPSELGDIPSDWDLVSMSDLGNFGRGRVISHTEINKAISKKFPVYSSQTSNNGIMGYIDTFDFDGEFITWTTDGVNAGKVFYRNGKFNCTNVCGVIKVDSLNDASYVALAMDLEARQYVSTNLANPKLMNGVAKQILVRLPKSKAEQEKISNVILGMEKEIELNKSHLSKLKNIKQGLMQNLLTGKIRLTE